MIKVLLDINFFAAGKERKDNYEQNEDKSST